MPERMSEGGEKHHKEEGVKRNASEGGGREKVR